MMAVQFQAIRGMHDILPEQTPRWRQVEGILQQILAAYGYQEIRFPLVERTELFKRATGAMTDIVEKEMYSFIDQSNIDLSLRPEGTPVCVRAGLEHGLLYNQQQRWWYYGPMFRHERPQHGRYRQFHQLGAEAFGMEGPEIDAELIGLTARFWRQLGIDGKIKLQINSLGSAAARAKYREHLVDYFQQYHEKLDEDSKRRLTSNPLRILDSKNPALQEIIQQAPKLLDVLDDESLEHFTRLKALLDAMNISYTVNPSLVRGLDYYNRTVFEWVTDSLGAQNTVCAGGRYDGLVEQLGGKATPAIGFALGMERLLLLHEQPSPRMPATLYLMTVGEKARTLGISLAEQIRNLLPELCVITDCSGGFKQQFKRADKSAANFALILGDEEVENKVIGVKDLRQESMQQSLTFDELINYLKQLI